MLDRLARCQFRSWRSGSGGDQNDVVSSGMNGWWRRGNELNCLITAEAKRVCQRLIDERTRYATECLSDLGCPRLAERVAQHPAKCGLYQFDGLCSRIRLCVCTPKAIEQARWIGCNKEEIEELFKRLEHLLNRDASLILNAHFWTDASDRKDSAVN
jgi:hypothetical protein